MITSVTIIEGFATAKAYYPDRSGCHVQRMVPMCRTLQETFTLLSAGIDRSDHCDLAMMLIAEDAGATPWVRTL